MDAEKLSELERVLARNYNALGFTLLYLKISEYDAEQDKQYLQGSIKCPCGGIEYFGFIMYPHLEKDSRADIVSAFALNILHNTASRMHLEQDVADGTLPPFDIEKHVFRGVLL